MHPKKILEQYWGYSSFRPLQEDIIEAVIQGEDTFALLPTGGGKSICFQIPALLKEGLCIVVSPLIALMKNQVADLNKKGIKAIALTSQYKYSELDVVLDNCIYGDYKFLYLSPERLQQDIVKERIQQMQVNLIAVDEAHCISQWGNDFRPAYKNIIQLREILPSVNVIALTASATPKVTDDIIKELDFISPKIFKSSFFRNNLSYIVYDTEDKLYRIEQILKKHNGSSIIYVRNRKSTHTVSKQLEDKGISSTYYHGGLTNLEKDNNFSDWFNNRKLVMVATNAFGMGIDKPDVKTVIHINLPESIESYFQEAGRAGRNNENAYAVILKNKGDEDIVKNQFLSVLPTIDNLKLVYRKLCNFFQISYGEGDYSTHDFDFNTFCKSYNFNTILTFNALQALDRTSIISLTKQFRNRATLKIIVDNNTVLNYLKTHPESALILKVILRTYGGIFDLETKINTKLVAEKSESNEDRVTDVLKQLQKDEIIDLKLSTTDAQITFLEPREDDKTINRIASIIEQQNRVKKDHVDAVLDYINNEHICKSVQLLDYFGEQHIEPCGICSVCLSKRNKTRIDTTNSIQIIVSALKGSPLSSREIINKTNLEENVVLQALTELLEDSKIEITNVNTYKIK